MLTITLTERANGELIVDARSFHAYTAPSGQYILEAQRLVGGTALYFPHEGKFQVEPLRKRLRIV